MKSQCCGCSFNIHPIYMSQQGWIALYGYWSSVIFSLLCQVFQELAFLTSFLTSLSVHSSIVAFKAKYLLILLLCHDSMFSSQGHVNSMGITFFKTLEKIVISGLRWVKAVWIAKRQLVSISARRTQSDVWCKMPTGGVLLCGSLVLFFTNLMDTLGEIGTACFIFKMKLERFNDLAQNCVKQCHILMYISLVAVILYKLVKCVR